MKCEKNDVIYYAAVKFHLRKLILINGLHQQNYFAPTIMFLFVGDGGRLILIIHEAVPTTVIY